MIISAKGLTSVINSDAGSAATNDVLVSRDSATNNAAIKFFGDVFAFLLPADKHGFSILVHFAMDMFTSGIPSVTIHLRLHGQLKNFHHSYKNYVQNDSALCPKLAIYDPFSIATLVANSACPSKLHYSTVENYRVAKEHERRINFLGEYSRSKNPRPFGPAPTFGEHKPPPASDAPLPASVKFKPPPNTRR